jgi:hypothetical protein
MKGRELCRYKRIAHDMSPLNLNHIADTYPFLLAIDSHPGIAFPHNRPTGLNWVASPTGLIDIGKGEFPVASQGGHVLADQADLGGPVVLCKDLSARMERGRKSVRWACIHTDTQYRPPYAPAHSKGISRSRPCANRWSSLECSTTWAGAETPYQNRPCS